MYEESNGENGFKLKLIEVPENRAAHWHFCDFGPKSRMSSQPPSFFPKGGYFWLPPYLFNLFLFNTSSSNLVA